MRKMLIIGAGVLFAAQLALGCPDPVLKTNTDPKLLIRRYREVSETAGKSRTADRQEQTRGAARLMARKEDCFLYPTLLPQAEVPCLAPLIRAYDQLPKRTERVTTTHNGKQVKLAVHLIGTGSHENVLICVPGVMADHREYRFVVGVLGADYDFWLIDPPGCGESDAPDPKMIGKGGYSPEAMADRELQAIAALLDKSKTPAHFQVLAHSMGGLVVLRAFAGEDLRLRYREVLERIDGLVLLAPCNVFMSQVSPELIGRAEISGLKIDIGQGLGVVREKVAQFLAGGFYSSHCLSREEVDHAVEILTNPSTRRAFQAMLLEALPFDTRTHQPRFDEMIRLEREYKNVDLPVRILWGKCDQTLPVMMGYMLEKQLPNAQLTVMPDCKHAPNLECPMECARLIRLAQEEIAAEVISSTLKTAVGTCSGGQGVRTGVTAPGEGIGSLMYLPGDYAGGM